MAQSATSPMRSPGHSREKSEQTSSGYSAVTIGTGSTAENYEVKLINPVQPQDFRGLVVDR